MANAFLEPSSQLGVVRAEFSWWLLHCIITKTTTKGCINCPALVYYCWMLFVHVKLFCAVQTCCISAYMSTISSIAKLCNGHYFVIKHIPPANIFSSMLQQSAFVLTHRLECALKLTSVLLCCLYFYPCFSQPILHSVLPNQPPIALVLQKSSISLYQHQLWYRLKTSRRHCNVNRSTMLLFWYLEQHSASEHQCFSMEWKQKWKTKRTILLTKTKA